MLNWDSLSNEYEGLGYASNKMVQPSAIHFCAGFEHLRGASFLQLIMEQNFFKLISFPSNCQGSEHALIKS